MSPSAIETGQSLDSYGNWLSGFVDGEGCFGIYCYKSGKNASFDAGFLSIEFSVQLREDDKKVLDGMQEYFKCGTVVKGSRAKARKDGRAARDQYSYKCRCVADINKYIIPHFDKYPLRSKKLQDYILWKKAVALTLKSVLLRGDKNKPIALYPECVAIRKSIWGYAQEMRAKRNPHLQRGGRTAIMIKSKGVVS